MTRRSRPPWRPYDILTLFLLVMVWPAGVAMVVFSRAWSRRQKTIGVTVSGLAVVIYPVLAIWALVFLSSKVHASESWKVAATFVVGVPLWVGIIWSVVFLANARRWPLTANDLGADG